MKDIYGYERDILSKRQAVNKLRVEYEHREADEVKILEKKNGDLSNNYRITVQSLKDKDQIRYDLLGSKH